MPARILKYVRKKKGYTIGGTQFVLTSLACVGHVRPILSGQRAGTKRLL